MSAPFDPDLTWPVVGVKEDDTILRTPARNTTLRVRTKHLGKPAGDEATLPGLWRVVEQNRPTLGTVQFVLSPSSLDEAKRKGKSK